MSTLHNKTYKQKNAHIIKKNLLLRLARLKRQVRTVFTMACKSYMVRLYSLSDPSLSLSDLISSQPHLFAPSKKKKEKCLFIL